MTDFIFVNPSPNMETVAIAVQEAGRSVMRMFTQDYIAFRPDNIWTFINRESVCISEKRAFAELDANVSNLRKPFFPSLKYKYINKKLSEINPYLKSGTFQDSILLTGQLWQDADIPIKINDMSFKELVDKYPTSTVITARVPAPAGKYAITFWRTDYDIQEAMGKDYFFFFDGTNRYEAFCSGEDLVTVALAHEKLDWLKKINPTMARFAFEKKSSIPFYQNRNAWLVKHAPNIYLLNDYSWQGASVKLPDSWIKAVRKLVSDDKKKR